MKKGSLANLVMRRKYAFLLLFFLAGFACWLIWPVGTPFPNDYSTLIFDANGQLLRATLAGDQQFRFPHDRTSLPSKYVTALLTSEDKRFYSHPGVDPIAIARAAYTNLKARKRLSGGSTITMQVARLSRPKRRTLLNKFRECLVALKLSLHYSKEEILGLYSAHAPMGGNIVGLQAASYLYYGKPPEELTWAEACLFTILPNAPSMINLERERPILKRRRNELLERLQERAVIDRITYETGCQEPLPKQDRDFPFAAPHFTRFVMDHQGGERITTTLDEHVQKIVSDAASQHHEFLANHGITNLAVIVVETKTSRIRGYLGSQDYYDEEHAGQVDGVQAFRSTGSLLKPFLVAKCLDRGPYTIHSKIQDVPTFYGTFAPQNASKEFSGLTSIKRMLIHSLNVPSTRLLNAYGCRDFYNFLVEAGLQGLFRAPEGYGLTLVLGGAEASLFELTQLYLSLANFGRYRPLQAIEAHDSGNRPRHFPQTKLFSAGAAWLVLNVLTELSRPGVEYYWDQFNDQIPVAWKTGTSYGQKDGWAVGVNKQWTIGVWVGNFTGEGNAELAGAKSAAPLLFALFNALTRRDQPMWFDEPVTEIKEVECCKVSGYPAGPYCIETELQKRPKVSNMPGICPYHRAYLVDKHTGKSVCSLCWEGIDTEWVNLFIVPPSAREIMMASGRQVDAVPVHSGHCPNFHENDRIEIVYPVKGIKILVPRDLDGEYEKIVLAAKHQQPSTHLFWYLNGSLVGETAVSHEFPIDLDPGSYKLTVQDEEGYARSVSFMVYKKDV